MVSTVPNFKNDFENLAEAFLRDLGKNYVLRKGEKFNPKMTSSICKMRKCDCLAETHISKFSLGGSRTVIPITDDRLLR
jgi:hypothetical protein